MLPDYATRPVTQSSDHNFQRNVCSRIAVTPQHVKSGLNSQPIAKQRITGAQFLCSTLPSPLHTLHFTFLSRPNAPCFCNVQTVQVQVNPYYDFQHFSCARLRCLAVELRAISARALLEFQGRHATLTARGSSVVCWPLDRLFGNLTHPAQCLQDSQWARGVEP